MTTQPGPATAGQPPTATYRLTLEDGGAHEVWEHLDVEPDEPDRHCWSGLPWADVVDVAEQIDSAYRKGPATHWNEASITIDRASRDEAGSFGWEPVFNRHPGEVPAKEPQPYFRPADFAPLEGVTTRQTSAGPIVTVSGEKPSSEVESARRAAGLPPVGAIPLPDGFEDRPIPSQSTSAADDQPPFDRAAITKAFDAIKGSRLLIPKGPDGQPIPPTFNAQKAVAEDLELEFAAARNRKSVDIVLQDYKDGKLTLEKALAALDIFWPHHAGAGSPPPTNDLPEPGSIIISHAGIEEHRTPNVPHIEVLRQSIERQYADHPTGCGGSFGEILCYEIHTGGLHFIALSEKWGISLPTLGILVADHINRLEIGPNVKHGYGKQETTAVDPVGTFSVVINGMETLLEGSSPPYIDFFGVVTMAIENKYEDEEHLAEGYKGPSDEAMMEYTVTWYVPGENRGGSMSPDGDKVRLVNGMIFNAVVTGGA